MRPVLSIIIPTKDRYPYLESCLRGISSHYNNDRIEIIITDNSSEQFEIQALRLFDNVTYSYISKPISQVENFELALGMVTGEYVTMIGDDDGISDLLIDVVDYMNAKNIEALIAPFVSYYWPDVVSQNVINDFAGKIFFKDYTYKLTVISAVDEVEKCLNLGGGSLCNLPRMYYGIINKEVLEKVKAASGVYFPGPSPDMANAFSNALYTNMLVLFDAPLFIAGNSAKSAAGLGLSGKHVGSIEGNPMLPSDCHVKWSKLVPKYWSGPTIWAESVLKAIELTGNYNIVQKFNFVRLYADCLSFNREYSDLIHQTIAEYAKDKSAFAVSFNLKKEQVNILTLRLRFLIINIYRRLFGSKKFVYSNITDIEQAMGIIKKFEPTIREKMNGK
jgi:glycosyltransferase involved in cell wall biosynthesis